MYAQLRLACNGSFYNPPLLLTGVLPLNITLACQVRWRREHWLLLVLLSYLGKEAVILRHVKDRAVGPSRYMYVDSSVTYRTHTLVDITG